MGEHPLAGVMAQLAVDQGGEPVSQMVLAARRGPDCDPLTRSRPLLQARERPWRSERRSARASGDRCCRALRSCERPRWIRLRTVPSFTPRVAAISSYERPSMSQSTTAARNSGARVSSACWTSASKWRVVEDLLRGRLAARQALGGVVAEGVEADPLLAADHVQEEVRGDAVQPALEGAGRVGRQRAEDADEDFLGEVLGVVLVARQAVGEAVDPAAVRADDLLPGRAESTPAIPRQRRRSRSARSRAAGERSAVLVTDFGSPADLRKRRSTPPRSTGAAAPPLSALVVSSRAPTIATSPVSSG